MGVDLEQEPADRRAPLVDDGPHRRRRERPGRVGRDHAVGGPQPGEPAGDDRQRLVGGGLGQRRQDADAIDRGLGHVAAQLDPLLGLAHQHDRHRRLLVQLHERGEQPGHALAADEPGDRLELVEAQHHRPRRRQAQRPHHLEGPGLGVDAVLEAEQGQVLLAQLGGPQPVDDRALGLAIGDAAEHPAEVGGQGRQRRQAAAALVEQRPQLRVLLRHRAEGQGEAVTADQRVVDAGHDVVVAVLVGVGPHRHRDLAQHVPQQALEHAGGGQALHRVAGEVAERRGVLERRHVDAHVLAVGAAAEVGELVGLAHAGVAGDQHHLRPPVLADGGDGVGDRGAHRGVDGGDVGRRRGFEVEPDHRIGERARGVEEQAGEIHGHLRAT